MKKILIALFATAALASCKQSDHMEDHQPYEASETGTNTSEEVVTPGPQRATQETISDTAVQDNENTKGTQDTVKKPAPLKQRKEVTPPDISKPQ
jgi:hypothetical protein